MHGWCWFGLHKGDIYPKLAAILIDLVDSEFWWVEIEPVKKACELALESTSLSSKSPLLRLLPIDALLSKGPVPLAVQVSCSTLSLRTGQDFKKQTAHWDCSAVLLQCFGETHPQQCCSLRSASVPAWLWGSWRTVTFRSGSSS